MIEANAPWSQLKAMITEGERCSKISDAKVWKSRTETALRRAILYAPLALEPKLAAILGDIQRLNLERHIQRLGGPDTILDLAQRDQVIDLLNLACELGATESSATDLHPAEAARPIRRQQRRGPAPNMEAHRAIAQLVNRYDGNWAEEQGLEKIAAQLHQRKVPLPKGWSKWKPRPWSWKRAVEYHRERVRSCIAYSLKMAARENGPTPSTPS